MKRDLYGLPDPLCKFAQFYGFHTTIEELTSLTEDKDWDCHQTQTSSDYPIFENYMQGYLP